MDVVHSMTRLIQVLGAVLLVGGLAYHFAALRIFNFVVSRDQGVVLVAADVAYGSHPRQMLEVFAPSQATGPLPVLIFVHGGSWDSGRAQDYEFVARAFAARGYLVFLPGYRFVSDAPFPSFVEDVATVVNVASHVAANYGGDGQRIFLVGHSAGGYNILQAVLDRSYFEKAGVQPGTVRAVATLAAPADFLPLDSPKTIAAFSAVQPLADTQPINFARADAPPVLLLHGSADTTVYPRNSASLYQKLKLFGADVRYREYSGVSHVMIMLAIAKPLRDRAPTLEDILTFFDHYK